MSTSKSSAILEILTVGGNFDPVDNQNSPRHQPTTTTTARIEDKSAKNTQILLNDGGPCDRLAEMGFQVGDN
jgi:hypothetical protein